MTLKDLEKLGLEGKRAKIYLAILELGKTSIIKIAQKTGVKRTTVYDVVMDLMNLKLITETKRGAKRIFAAEDPAILKNFYENKLNEVKNLIPILSKIYVKVSPKPQFKFYDGPEGIKRLMEESLNAKNKEQLYWGSIGDLVELFGNRYMENWVKRRIRRGIRSRCILTAKSRISKWYERSDEGVLREIKWLRSKNAFDGALCVFDDKIMYISSAKESFGFIVESVELSNFLRLLFKMIWDSIAGN